MSPSPLVSIENTGQPYPLKRYFYTRVIPSMMALMTILSALLWLAFDQVTKHIYLEQAQIRAEVMADSVRSAAPDAWQDFLKGQATPADLEALHTIFSEEIVRQKLINLKVYDLRGTIIFDLVASNIGRIETASSLRYVIVNLEPILVRKEAPDGSLSYEIYAPFQDDKGNLRAIFEFYEEVTYLDTLLLETAIPAISLPVILQIVLMAIFSILVRRAQRDIDSRTTAIRELSQRLETFVSSSALHAAKSASNTDSIPSRNVMCTLFHSDVRDFTSYAEANAPERVVYFLNDLMTIQVNIVTHFGGDVDKMIGDALLVRFEGKDAEKRAIQAAKAILDACHRASLARGLGIGIFTGKVISGAIGPKSRRDFTVIGDSVNMSARLCSAAKVGELVVDAASAKTAKAPGFSDDEKIQVKGRNEPLAVRRWTVEQLTDKA